LTQKTLERKEQAKREAETRPNVNSQPKNDADGPIALMGGGAGD